MWIELIKLTALLLALVMLLSLVFRTLGKDSPKSRFAQGVLFGVIAVLGMTTPVNFAPGFIFDPRSVIVSVAGFFGGPFAAVPSALIAGGYRLWLGGAGALAGMLVVVLSALAGVGAYYLRRKQAFKITPVRLLVFGLASHFLASGGLLVLPDEVMWKVIGNLAVPFFLIYPPVTVFLGYLILDIEQKYDLELRLKASEQKLTQSEKQLRTLIDTMPDLVWLKDPQGVYLSCNSSYLAFLDLPCEKVIGMTDYDLYDQAIADAYRKYDHLALEAGGPCTNEEDAVYADGRVEQLETIKTPVYDPQGGCIGVLGIGRNITGRKRSERQLVESERRFRAIFNQAAVGIARVSPDGQWLEVNDKLCEIVGYPREQLIKKTFQEITFAEDLDSDVALVNQTLAGERETYAMDKRYIRSSGDLVWIRLTVSLCRDDMGEPLYFISVIEDIDERKKTEEKLREAAAVFSSTAEGVIITGPDGNILDVNRAFTRITGYSRDEVAGENPRMLKSGRHEEQFYLDMWSHIQQNGHWSGEIWNRAKNGAIFPEILTISAVQSETGEATGYVGVFSDISTLKATEARLDHMAHHDPLTGLPNRALFRDRLIHGLERCKRSNKKVAVVFLDVDHFKNINDTMGHSVGDQLLLEIARRLKQVTRSGDTVGRISGDEFCLVIEELGSLAEAAPLVEKLMSVFETPFQVKDHSLRVTSSVGVAIYPENAKDSDALLSYADAAMYEAKEAGRNTYRFYTTEMTEQAIEYSFVQTALREALEQSQFYLVYQPQVDLNSKALVGLEALVRWQHPERGLISPAKFIPIAERSGLIRELGAWILRTACIQGKAWMDAGLAFKRIYVNVAGPQLHDHTFPELVRECLAETGFPKESLGLEVTEGFVMGASEHAIEGLLALRESGIKVAIDDFGTGYSSLSYLKKLPIDKLKIDQSFVRDIPHDKNDMAIAEAVIAMGHALNMDVIAEGVEDPRQEAFLLSKGCHEAQGFIFSRPLTAPELEAWCDMFLGAKDDDSV